MRMHEEHAFFDSESQSVVYKIKLTEEDANLGSLPD